MADVARNGIGDWGWNCARAVGVAAARERTVFVHVVGKEDEFFIVGGVAQLVLGSATEEVGGVH